MKKVIFYEVYYFEDYPSKKKFYFEEKADAEMCRFVVYKSYDKQRLSVRNFVVPVSRVEKKLIPEDKVNAIRIIKDAKEFSFTKEERCR